jgi:cytochrome P450
MRAHPPGPTDLPLVGATPYYARDPFRFMTDVRDAYGDVATFRLGRQQTYMVTTPTAVERVLVDDADAFSKPDFQTDAMEQLLGQGLLLSEGPFWREMRQLAQPAFSPGRIADLTEMMAERADQLVERWEPGEVRDVEAEMARVTVEIIVDAMFGAELGPARTRRVQENLEPLGRRFEPDPKRAVVPDWLPTAENREYQAAIENLEAVIDDVVAERRADDSDDADDLLGILLAARERGDVDERQIRDEMMTMLLAGHDTTALTLTYTWFLLSEHPEAKARVHSEVDEVVGDDRRESDALPSSRRRRRRERPGMEHVREFEYLEWVINESMRLYPPVFTVFRTPKERVELSGYEMPEGATLMLPQWGVHRSERFWDDPEKFDPERFSPERRADRPRFAYFPFGGGPRHCIGKHLAMLEARLIVATVADRYRLEYDRDSPPELAPTLTAHPRDGMPMRVVERET